MFQSLSPSGTGLRPETVVLHPYAGIGDMVWHLPILKALAADDPSGRIDLVISDKLPVPPMLGNENIVSGYLPLFLPRDGIKRRAARREGLIQGVKFMLHDRWQRVSAIFYVANALRGRGYQRVFLLHNSARYGMAAKYSGIAKIYGYGFGKQRKYLTDCLDLPFADRKLFPLYLGRMLLDRLGIANDKGPPVMHPRADLTAAMAAAFASHPKPWVAMPVGSTEDLRIWPPERFAIVADALAQAGYRSIFMLGAKHESELAEAAIARCKIARPLNVTDRRLEEVIALISQCALSFCTDSGLMNISAALGVPTYVLFATVPPYTYSPSLRPIVPAGGINKIMGASVITVDEALARLREDGIIGSQAAPLQPEGQAACSSR